MPSKYTQLNYLAPNGLETKGCELGTGFMYTASSSTVTWMIGAPYNIGSEDFSMKDALLAVCTMALVHMTVTQASATDTGSEVSTLSHASDALRDSSTAAVSTEGLPQITARAGVALGAVAALLPDAL
ncbi:hypothetical protein PENANT_c003G11655 [Penicillium antarcticum]|uniref:Uncharacterized protein n=1 Tax=Penicillium antarcticum TaxID=416450 RepID=A0A1V6QIE2_9EURO|nr:hypothetical protein PENANT_c003G11655 [Penicillium antarcticum]